ncbi:hypothetical protein J6590_009857 [Homalodisca vitripennis]|nr:hypothetical protein J6590_009857 [Homalodisca vitripennis]
MLEGMSRLYTFARYQRRGDCMWFVDGVDCSPTDVDNELLDVITTSGKRCQVNPASKTAENYRSKLALGQQQSKDVNYNLSGAHRRWERNLSGGNRLINKQQKGSEKGYALLISSVRFDWAGRAGWPVCRINATDKSLIIVAFYARTRTGTRPCVWQVLYESACACACATLDGVRAREAHMLYVARRGEAQIVSWGFDAI